ncbi:MAG: lamin tail domain-containing protein [Candidatus Promineifilaceae bacterium]
MRQTALEVVCLAAALAVVAAASAAPAGDRLAQTVSTSLLISEVFYNPAGADDGGEWIELYNASEAAIQLRGFKLGDEEERGEGEGMASFPEGAAIDVGGSVVVAASGAAFRARFGRWPDYEWQPTSAEVPDLLPYAEWATGTIGLANDGDTVLLLDPADQIVDAVAYGEGRFPDERAFRLPAVPTPLVGHSIERRPATCDTNSAGDWLSQPLPRPGQVVVEGACRPAPRTTANGKLRIGAVQGPGLSSPYVNHIVQIEGIFTGRLAELSSSGTEYHTLFVQELPGREDGDSATSDGLAIFMGTKWPSFAPGDHLLISGQVTEFFGLTELAGDELSLTISARNQPLPSAVLLAPPAGPADLERFEGMRVALPPAVITGPTLASCSLTLQLGAAGGARAYLRTGTEPSRLGLGLLNYSERNCQSFPQLNAGDRLAGAAGPLTYHFGRYKVVAQDPAALAVEQSEPSRPRAAPTPGPGQISLASFNLYNLGPPSFSGGLPLAVKLAKLSAAIADLLGCPDILGVQEVQSRDNLEQLAARLGPVCGFSYTVSHRDSPDPRGSDVALLTHADRIAVQEVGLRQGCGPLDFGVNPYALCGPGEHPIFDRPPLEAHLEVGGRELIVLVNHFKSKRGGEAETAPQRLAQADYLGQLAAELNQSRPEASLILMGDFNDYEASAVRERLIAKTPLVDALQGVPDQLRYSYVFDGLPQLIDWILISPELAGQLAAAGVVHANADFAHALGGDVSQRNLPLRASDHDAPFALLNLEGVAARPEGAAALGASNGPSLRPWQLVAAGALGLLLLVLLALRLR